MDSDSPFLKALFHIFGPMPQQAPGSPAITAKALGLLPALPAKPRILDLGCGSGRTTLVLAKELQMPVEAVDIYQPFLDRLKSDAAGQGLGRLITTRQADITDLDYPPASVDLIWAEGSIFLPGFAKGLEHWGGLLKPGGFMALTESAWFVDDPAPEALAFWNDTYPAITSIEGNLALIEQAGLTNLDHFRLPASDWDVFYDHLDRRITELSAEAAEDPSLAGVLEFNRREIAIWREFRDSYGYVFFILQKPRPA